MQLEFFGERFDRSKCGKTCDNCKAGREIEKRDLTDVARQILLLLSDVAAQRNGRGVTMTQLTELFRGSANKSITQYLQVNKLKGYGAGKKYGFKKNDLDRVAHAMVLDKILLESSEQNGGGFNSDYVRPGQFADQIQNGQKQFFVQFPKAGSKPKSGKENKAGSDKKKKAKKKKAAPAKKSPAPKSRTVKANKGRLFISEDSDDSDSDDDELFNDTSRVVGSKSSSPAILPKKHTQALSKRIKKLLEMWAEEERMATGNRVFRKFLCLQQSRVSLRVHAFRDLLTYSRCCAFVALQSGTL
jgi:bloom syndrome protein